MHHHKHMNPTQLPTTCSTSATLVSTLMKHSTPAVTPARASRGVLCRSGNGDATPESGGDPARAALLARIAKAKQYKQGGSTAASNDTPAPGASPPPLPPPSTTPRVVDWGAVAGFLDSQGKSAADESSFTPVVTDSRFRNAEEIAADEEAERQRQRRFEAAKDKMSDEFSPMDTDNEAYTKMILTATQAPGRGSADKPAAFLQNVLKDDDENSADGLDASTMRMEEFTAAKEAKLRQMGAEILTVDPTYRAKEGSESDGGEIVSTTRDTGRWREMLGLDIDQQPPPAASGTDTVASSTSVHVATGQEADQQQGAGTTSSSGSAAAAGDKQEEVYKPKVTTWGVFPRPKDISKEYGGGRNLKPGQELETKEQKAAREAAFAAALQSYKTKAGLEVEPMDEAAAQELYDEGMVLFAKANLQGAYDKFQDALKLVPLKSRVGGLAGLQAAIILDSQGLQEPAQKLYRQLQGHAVASVARKAKQMLFGFQAAKFLKADTISYAPKKGEFDRYFRGITDRNRLWAPSEAEKAADEDAAKKASLIAVVVLLGPLALLAGIILQK